MYSGMYKFGQAIRKERKNLCLTQKEVTFLAGVNNDIPGLSVETLRRIEGGKVIPKFETLELLSTVYKKDLNSLILKYRISNYSYFYEIKSILERKFTNNELHTLNIELEELNSISNNISNSFYKKSIKQLILLTEALILYENRQNHNEALAKLIKAIKIFTPSFKLNDYKSFVYSSIEIRLLMNIALVLNKLDYEKKYEKILEFCVENLEFNEKLYPQLCHNLSGVYRRNKNFKKALKYSNIGIKSSQQNRNLNVLNILYYGKGIAEYKLDKKEYIESLNTSIALSKAFGQEKSVETIMHNCKNIFDIDLTSNYFNK